jgi:site-specific DNA recombinase
MPSTNGHGPKPERVALYLRVSSQEQRDRETIEIQRDFLEQYRALYELEVADIYKDDGISGTIPLHERPEGKRLLEDAKAGNFETVLLYKLDRLSRSLLVIVDAHDRLQASGVGLRSATEPIDTSNPSGRLIFQMLASFAEYERETIGERTRAGLHRALRNGKHAGRIPYGYKLSPDESGLEVVEEEARIVREILANIAEGATLYGESKRLNDEGVPSPGWRFKNGERKHGASWSPSTVRAILYQSAYSGVHRVRVGKEDHIEREVPPIVEPGLQKRAVAALEANKHRASPERKGARKYLLSGLVRCGMCGFACTGRTSTSRVSGGTKKYSYYGCVSHRAERGASTVPPHRGPNVSAPWLENLVWTDVKRFVRNPGEVLERVREQLRGEGDDSKDLHARRDDLAKRLADKQSEKDRYIRLYAQGHISDTELETYLADLKNQISNLRLLVEAAEADLSQRREQAELADTTYAWLTALRDRVEEIEADTPDAFLKRQQLVRLLVDRITVVRGESGETTVEITYRFGPPDDLGEEDSFVGNLQNSCGNLAAKRKPSGTISRHLSTVERRGVP